MNPRQNHPKDRKEENPIRREKETKQKQKQKQQTARPETAEPAESSAHPLQEPSCFPFATRAYGAAISQTAPILLLLLPPSALLTRGKEKAIRQSWKSPPIFNPSSASHNTRKGPGPAITKLPGSAPNALSHLDVLHLHVFSRMFHHASRASRARLITYSDPKR